MTDAEAFTRLRIIRHGFGVLINQAEDPFCPQCSAYKKVGQRLMAETKAFEALNRNIPGAGDMRASIERHLKTLKFPENPLRQKKEGNCLLPKGVCFTKPVLALFGAEEE